MLFGSELYPVLHDVKIKECSSGLDKLGSGQAKVGSLSGSNKLGRVAAETRTPRSSDSERAPAESPMSLNR
jgi:hypothetical protein